MVMREDMEAYRYVENIRRYQLSLEGYLQAKESKIRSYRKTKKTIQPIQLYYRLAP